MAQNIDILISVRIIILYINFIRTNRGYSDDNLIKKRRKKELNQVQHRGGGGTT